MAWSLDMSHSEITFAVKHMMISTVRGKFNTFSGTIDFNEQDPALSTVDVSVDLASVDTRDEKRDGHLKSPDFFDVANHPTMSFKSTSVQKISDNQAKVTGDLTIRGVTQPLTLDVTYNGQAKSPWGMTSAGFSATGKLNRKAFGLEWNVALETGGVLVGEDVSIAIEAEIVNVAEAAAA
jgi:polyisoprenoid-binding protein YceI